MSEHTAGPWHLEHFRGNGYFVFAEGKDRHDASICYAEGADACLIAAAPEYDSLLAEIITEVKVAFSGFDLAEQAPTLNFLIEEAEALRAKVRGEQS